jgi:phage shock protein E
MNVTLLNTLVLACMVASLRAAEPTHSTASATAAARPASGSFKNVNPQEFEKLRRDKNPVVLDVRTPKEYAAGHIPGAVNIDFNAADFDKKIAALDTNKTYLVHCAGGVRSAKACEKLGKLQIPTLYNLEGGLKAWEKAGNKPER